MKPPYFLLTRMDGDREEMLSEVPATRGRNGWFWHEPVPAISADYIYAVHPEDPATVREPLEVIVGHLSQGGTRVTLDTLRDLHERGVLDRVCFGVMR